MNKNTTQPMKGFRDRWGKEWQKIEYLRNLFLEKTSSYGFMPITTPILENRSLFIKSVGENSDIVMKEMYSFEDKNGDWVVLRPEMTASVARAVINNQLNPIRLCYFDTMFRRENTQKGRSRCFIQGGVEFVGESSLGSDIEVLNLAIEFLEQLGIIDDVTLVYNNLGNKKTMEIYNKAFVSYMNQKIDNLSHLSKNRLTINPLRIWDSKELQDQQVLEEAPLIDQYLTQQEKNYNKDLAHYLEGLNIKIQFNPRLVRGLDYYNGLVFEFTINDVTILGGGRYDNLIQKADSTVPCIGWACGVDRIVDLTSVKFDFPQSEIVFICPISCREESYAAEIGNRIRKLGLSVALKGSNQELNKRLSSFSRMSTQLVWAVIIGDQEVENNNIVIRNISKSEQKTVKIDDLKKSDFQ